MDMFVTEHDVELTATGVRRCSIRIERKLDKTVVILWGFYYGDNKYHVPFAVTVYYPNDERETWTQSETYRKVLDADLIQEIDRQIALVYLMLS